MARNINLRVKISKFPMGHTPQTFIKRQTPIFKIQPATVLQILMKPLHLNHYTVTFDGLCDLLQLPDCFASILRMLSCKWSISQGPNSCFRTALPFFPKILFHPSPPKKKKSLRRVRWDTTVIRRIKLKLPLHTPISVTDFCRNGIAMSMGGAYSKEISVAWYVTHAGMLHMTFWLGS